MPGAAKKNGKNGAAQRFPAEASEFFAEVPADELERLRQTMKDEFDPNDWELVDGVDYPYAAHA